MFVGVCVGGEKKRTTEINFGDRKKEHRNNA